MSRSSRWRSLSDPPAVARPGLGHRWPADRAALALATLSLLALLPLLTLLAALALLALSRWPVLALLAEGVVEQLLLTADDVAELVHHLAMRWLLALVGHAARLQPVEQVAQLAQHLLGHVAVARARHVLEVAHHLLEILRAHHLVLRHARRHVIGGWPSACLASCSRNCASA